MKRVDISRDKLYDLYVNKKLSTCKISKILDKSQPAIYHWLKKYGIPTRSVVEANKKFKISEDKLYDLYVNQKLSIHQISRKFNIPPSSVYYWLKKCNISIRSYSEGTHLAMANHCSLPQEAIEWINGELLGDGCLVSSSKYSAYFIYTSKYKEYINYVSNTLESFGIKQSGKINKSVQTEYKGKTKECKFKKPVISYHYRSLSYEELYSSYKKWYPNGKKIVPKDIELTPIALRQHYIGDGCLIYPKNGNPYIILYTMGFTIGDVEFLVSKLGELGFKCTRQPSKNVIRISTHSVKDFLDYIGKCPVECYEYKWDFKSLIEEEGNEKAK